MRDEKHYVALLRVARAARHYVTLHGQHEGACTNKVNLWDSCEHHVEASHRRSGELLSALRGLDDITEADIVDAIEAQEVEE